MAEDKKSASSKIYRFGACELDVGLRQVSVAGEIVDVQPKIFDLLLYLIEHRERVVDKDELFDEVWAGTVVSESSLTQAIRRARAIAGDDGDRQRVIQTVQRRGYRFSAPVHVIEGATQDASADHFTVSGKRRPWRNIAALAAIAATVLVAAFLVYRQLERPVFDPQLAIQQIASPGKDIGDVSAASRRSVAVLPFINQSPDEANAYFADGLSEEILNLLASNQRLEVPGRTSSFRFRQSDADVKTVAHNLNVAHILEGSVSKSGNEARVIVRLVEADTGLTLWSKNYDRNLDDILDIQAEIANSVADELEAQLLEGEIIKVGDVDPKAYTLFLQARWRFRASTPDSIAEAESMLRESIRIDPDYAPAWDVLGVLYSRSAGLGLIPAEEGAQLARAALEKALEIDPEYAIAMAHLSWIAMVHDWDFDTADQLLQKAFTLQPRNATVLGSRATLAFILGRMDQSVTMRERVVAMDPLSRAGFHNLGSAYRHSGNPERAGAMYQHALALSPDYMAGHFYLGLTLLDRGDYDGAMREFMREKDQGWNLQGKALAYYALEQQEESDAALAELTALFAGDMAFQIAQTHAYRGDTEKAFEWLERAYEQRDGGLPEMMLDPLLVSLRDDPRWYEFLKKMRLAD